MRYVQYSNANDFLRRMRGYFEQAEVINGLMFGVCLQLEKDLFKYGNQPLFAVVGDDSVIRIAALMTPPHKLQLCALGSFSGENMKTLVQGLMMNKWDVPGVMAEKHLAQAFADEWKAYQRCGSREGMEQCIYELRNVQTIKYARGKFRQAKPNDMDRAIAWAHSFHNDCFGDTQPDQSASMVEQKLRDGELFFWEDRLPVAMAARTRPTPNGESIGLVYTPPEKRRQGYATSVVAALSQKLLDEGKRFCSLYTDLDNPTSNSIYRKIGYVPVANVVDIYFEY